MAKYFIACVVLLASLPCIAEEVPGYTECTITHYADNRTQNKPGMLDPDARAIFGNWNTPNAGEQVPSHLAVGAWNEVDLSRKLPAGTRCVALAGELIITRGYEAGQECVLFVSFRKNTEAGRASNTVYTTAAANRGGTRAPYSVVVPLNTDMGQMTMQVGVEIQNNLSGETKGYYGRSWPSYCSFGISGWIEGFGR